MRVLPMPTYDAGEKHEFKTNGIAWNKEKIVVAEIREVKPHPNADKLTLLDLFDGQQEQVVLTGAPNIFHLKGTGRLPKADQGGICQRRLNHLRRSRGWTCVDHAQTRQNPRRGFVLDGLL